MLALGLFQLQQPSINPNYAQQAQPDRYALWQQRIRHRHPVIMPVI
jgi:hypothetical protein